MHEAAKEFERIVNVAAAAKATPAAAVVAAYATAKAAVDMANRLRPAYIATAMHHAAQLRDAGAPPVTTSTTIDGWVGRENPQSTHGFRAAGQTMVEFDVPGALVVIT